MGSIPADQIEQHKWYIQQEYWHVCRHKAEMQQVDLGLILLPMCPPEPCPSVPGDSWSACLLAGASSASQRIHALQHSWKKQLTAKLWQESTVILAKAKYLSKNPNKANQNSHCSLIDSCINMANQGLWNSDSSPLRPPTKFWKHFYN